MPEQLPTIDTQSSPDKRQQQCKSVVFGKNRLNLTTTSRTFHQQDKSLKIGSNVRPNYIHVHIIIAVMASLMRRLLRILSDSTLGQPFD
jgi:hypothetical protein